MMSWTDEDVTFLGEDPYGDCAGNVFAAAAAEARRGRASVDETREPRASGDEDARVEARVDGRRARRDGERGGEGAGVLADRADVARVRRDGANARSERTNERTMHAFVGTNRRTTL